MENIHLCIAQITANNEIDISNQNFPQQIISNHDHFQEKLNH